VTLPIWDQNQAGIAKSRYALVQRRKELDDLQDEVRLTVAQALSRSRSLAAVASLHEKQIEPNDRASIDGARALYELGQQNVLVLLDAQEAVIGAARLRGRPGGSRAGDG
jgi:outer membrane protein TolC